MAKIKLISLYGIDPEFEERTPTDLSKINQKSFIIKFDRLNSANQFKHVWGKTNLLLENIINNLNSKKKFTASKEQALNHMFSNEQSLTNNPSLTASRTPTLKPKHKN